MTQVGAASEVAASFWAGYTYANAVAIQRDGRIITAGAAFTTFGTDPYSAQGAFGLARYRPDGSLDRSFGKHGTVTTPLPTNIIAEEDPQWPLVKALAIQRDGKILAGGSSDGATLVRYSRHGTLDPGFGTDGKVTAAMGEVLGLALQRDGKIVVVGFNFEVARYNPDGSLDQSFGSGGVVTPSFGRAQQGADGVAVQPNGKIVVTGWVEASDYSDNESALARFNSDGSLDSGFGKGGKVITPTGCYLDDPWPRTVLLRPNGKIVAMSNCTAQYRRNGSLDTAFGKGGIAHLNGTSAVLQRDGKIVTVPCGACGDGWRLRRYKVDGSPDSNFTASRWRRFYPRAVGLQRDGKIVAAGGPAHDKFALARYLGGQERCIVPKVVGKSLAKARRVIHRAYCSVGKITRIAFAGLTSGHVIEQRPKAGTRRPFGTEVRLVVSVGKH